MTTTVEQPPTTKNPPSEPGPIPPHVEREERDALALREANFAKLALLIDPKLVAQAIAAREQSLQLLSVACIKRTHSNDWTLYKDRDARVVGVLRDSGAVNVRKLMGISIDNYKPINASGVAEPQVTREPVGNGEEVTVVEMWADGRCALTGEAIEGVYYAIRSDDKFIGRERKRGEGDDAKAFVSLQDMKAACRTGLDAKVTRILSGLRKVPGEVLTAQGIAHDQAYKGHGFGTSSDRNAGKVADAGVKDGIEQLRAEVMKRVGGDIEAGKKLVKEITGNPEKGFKGFDSLDRLTQGWQIEQALRNLKKHPVFGDQGYGGGAAAAPAKGNPPAKGAPPVQERFPGEDD